MDAFAQTPCPRCNTTVYVPRAMGSVACPRCQTVVALNAGAAPMAGANPYAQPPAAPGQPFGAPGGGAPFGAAGGWPGAGGAPFAMGAMGRGFGRGAMFVRVAGIGLVALVAVAGGIARSYLRGSRGHSSLSAFSIDPHAAQPDAMITASATLAHRWRADAQFRSINVLGLRPDGTVDLTNDSNNVTVEFFSPSCVSSFLARDRDDSIKKFTFNASGIHYDTQWGVRQRVSEPVATPVPSCSIRQLASTLSAQGVAPNATLHLNYDPTFAFATGGTSYHLMGDGEGGFNGWFDPGTCARLQ